MGTFSSLRLIYGKRSARSAHEDCFLERYQRLFDHAERITRGDRDLAGDLLQDTFIYFTEAAPPLDEIENPDAYLYTILKHLHFAHLRKGMRDPLGELAIVDFESAETSLRAASSTNRFYICDQLIRICEYAYSRKDDSRSHSLLLLRFFHGYYMDELVHVAGNSRPTIRKWLLEAQDEVKGALLESAAGKSVTPSQWTRLVPLTAQPEEFLQTLRNFVWNFRQEACPSREKLIAHYSALSTDVPIDILGHLAGCRKCLDIVNELLGLPLLANRHLENIGERGRGPKSDSGAGSTSGRDHFDLRRARHRMETVAHHEPSKLRIRADGHERAGHDLGQDKNHFILNFSAREEMRVVEIVSEQDICLLTFVLHEPQSTRPLEWRRTLEMSNGRMLEATLRYGESWPSIEVAYLDMPHTETLKEANLSISKAPVMPNGMGHWWQRWFESIRKIALPDMNPTLATAIVLAVASAVCFFMWLHQAPTTVNALLSHAEIADDNLRANAASGVIYQKVRIKTPKRSMDRAIYRDLQGKRRPREQKLSQEDVQLKNSLAIASVSWDDPLSAKSYKEWHDRQQIREDTVQRSAEDLLTVTTTIAVGAVARETLTIRGSDFHPIARTVQFRNADTIEIAELNYDVMPWAAVNDDWFEPLPGTMPQVTNHSHAATLPHLPRILTQEELDEAELDVRLVLNELHADTSERIELMRNANGVVVRGIVATPERKQELETRLYRIVHVTPAISSFQELQNRPGTTNETSGGVRLSSSVSEPSALEKFLTQQGRTREQVTQLSQQLLSNALIAKQHSKAIAELQQRFAAGGELTASAREAFDQLMSHHKLAILAALNDEERDIAGAGIAIKVPAPSGNPEDLTASEEKNFALCVELTSGNGRYVRFAEEIVPELASSVARLRSVVLSLGSDSALAKVPSSPSQKN